MNPPTIPLFLRASAFGLVLLSAIVTSHAALPAYDGFEYTPGDSLTSSNDADGNGGTGWTNRWTGSGIATVTTSSTGISFTDANGATYGGGNALTFSGGSTQNAASRTFLATNDTGGADVYFSYIVNITNGTTSGTIPSGSFMSVGVLDNSFSVSVDNFAIIGGSKLGARTNNITSSINTNLQYDTTYLVVSRLHGWDGDSYTETTVWLNPTQGDFANTSVSATATSATGGSDGFRGITFRTNSLNGDVYAYDDLRVGTDWNSVVAAVPEPSTSAALAGLGALCAGFITRRFRRRA